MRAVVFAYHDVGYRCLSVLLAHGVDIPLVITHEDNPGENIWFESVERLARLHDLPVAKPQDSADPGLLRQVRETGAQFIFSFYYRHMLPAPLLECAAAGALNMHGSLLPRYRGRVPVNWAVIRGERETGATLHYMVAKADAGDIVDRQAVPILPDDTAGEVFGKVTVAAEMVLDRSLAALSAGRAPRIPQDLAAGSYFGGRRPEDGRIDWHRGAQEIHNLVRGVAPPYPGAFCDVQGRRLRVLRTLREAPGRAGVRRAGVGRPAMYCHGGRCYVECGDGDVLRVLSLEVDGTMLSDETFREAGDTPPVYLTHGSDAGPQPAPASGGPQSVSPQSGSPQSGSPQSGSPGAGSPAQP
jgi:methionyl-tRNA formyltransferase